MTNAQMHTIHKEVRPGRVQTTVILRATGTAASHVIERGRIIQIKGARRIAVAFGDWLDQANGSTQ